MEVEIRREEKRGSKEGFGSADEMGERSKFERRGRGSIISWWQSEIGKQIKEERIR